MIHKGNKGYTVSTASILNAANEKLVPSKERFNCQSILQLPRMMVTTAFIVFISGVCFKFLVYTAWFQVLKVSCLQSISYVVAAFLPKMEHSAELDRSYDHGFDYNSDFDSRVAISKEEVVELDISPLRVAVSQSLWWAVIFSKDHKTWKRIFNKRTKNKAKNDKTGHGVEKRGKAKVKSKPKSTRIKTGADTEEYLIGPPEPI
ncbi:hypothetical protein Tco_1391956 [Tanacetum coccineum]